MYVHESKTTYTLYVQNDKYANQLVDDINAMKEGNESSESVDSGLQDYLDKIVANIPELKSWDEAGNSISVIILPESASSTLKTAVDQTTSKMLEEGTDENVLKSVLGIVKANVSYDYQSYNATDMDVKNVNISYDMDSLNNVLSKFQEIYSSNGELSAGLSKFSEYLNDIYHSLTSATNSTSSTEDTASSSDENTNGTDLVETFIQELDKSENGTTTGSEELNKKLYKDYIKSLSSNLTGGLLQQSS